MDNLSSRNDHNNFKVLKLLANSLVSFYLLLATCAYCTFHIRVVRAGYETAHDVFISFVWFHYDYKHAALLFWFAQLIDQLPRLLLDTRIYHIGVFQNCPIYNYTMCRIVLAFWLVLTYDLLKDRQIPYVIDIIFAPSRFYVAVRLFSNHRSLKTSKCGKNISETLGYRPRAPLVLFLPHFDVICALLLNRRIATLNVF